jgi:hypothetical protein
VGRFFVVLVFVVVFGLSLVIRAVVVAARLGR